MNWCKLEVGWRKLNVNRSCRGNLGSCGGGGLIRDHVGRIHRTFCTFFGHSTNNEAELQALKEGVVFCKELGFS